MGFEYGMEVPNDDYVSVSMMDHITSDGVSNSQRLFASSRLMPQISVPLQQQQSEYELDASTVYSKYEAGRSFEAKHEKDYEKARKKRFLKEHL